MPRSFISLERHSGEVFMDSIGPTVRERIFPPRALRQLTYRSKPTVLIPGDRMSIDLRHGHVMFWRGNENMQMDFGNEAIQDTLDLSTVPNSVVASHIAELCAMIAGLDVKPLRRDLEMLVFEFC